MNIGRLLFRRSVERAEASVGMSINGGVLGFMGMARCRRGRQAIGKGDGGGSLLWMSREYVVRETVFFGLAQWRGRRRRVHNGNELGDRWRSRA